MLAPLNAKLAPKLLAVDPVAGARLTVLFAPVTVRVVTPAVVMVVPASCVRFPLKPNPKVPPTLTVPITRPVLLTRETAFPPVFRRETGPPKLLLPFARVIVAPPVVKLADPVPVVIIPV